MPEQQVDGEPAPLLRHFDAWIEPAYGTDDAAKQEYYPSAIIVPDTNVLLDLYQYTPVTRQQLLAALQSVSDRLWLPHQAGLEFVRGRAGVIKRRNEVLSRAPREVNSAFESAWKQIDSAAKHIKNLMVSYAGPDNLGEIDALMNRELFDQFTAQWKTALIERAKAIKDEHDIGPGAFIGGADELLITIAELFGDRIGEPVTEDALRLRVERATKFRYPNNIPPGFSDLGKDTELLAAGDFLLWEEVIEYAQNLPEPKVIFVSGDTKVDWYQQAGFGQKKQPWPYLIDEFRLRTGGRILITETAEFYADIKQYLGADIASSSIEEVNRPVAAPERDDEVFLSPKELGQSDPPSALVEAAYYSAQLSSKAVRQAIERPSDRLFQWWLIGVTRDLAKRGTESGEPLFDLQAFRREEATPGPSWVPADAVLHLGEFPYLSMYIAPWFATILELSPPADRQRLLRLAHEHGSATGFGAPDRPVLS
ncbi:PIN-like domain-containing protein [Kribbella sp. NPDC026596]|uniref:PIN-like domain-containing protein n=1 Tax=Kribbella sp. NPDC026596 TaxID=3155122 RepID=UPI0033F80FAF